MKRFLFLVLVLSVASAFGDWNINQPFTLKPGSSLIVEPGVPVTGVAVPQSSPSPTPQAGTIAVWQTNSVLRSATTSEVFNFTDDNQPFVPFYDTSGNPHHWERALFGSSFTVSGTAPNKIIVIDVDLSGLNYTDLPGLQAALDAKPTVVAKRFVTGRTAADSTFLTYAPAANGTFEVSMMMNVTAVTSISTSMRCSYTNQNSTVVNMILPATRTAGDWVSGGLVTQNGSFTTATVLIRVKTGTTITLFTDSGTFTGVSYNLGGVIKSIPE